MQDVIGRLTAQSNARSTDVRLKAMDEANRLIRAGTLHREVSGEVNNHVHTTYSFSPYEPAGAAWAAWQAGLGIVGSVDHESVGAATELLSACRALGIAGTVGFEVRCSFLDTPFANRKINNPDSKGIAYLCVHGIKSASLAKADGFLAPLRRVRDQRNRAQVERLNEILFPLGIDRIDFDLDVAPVSRSAEGGSITERHILYACSEKLKQAHREKSDMVRFLKRGLSVDLTWKQESLLLEKDNPHFMYDVLGILKSLFLPRFFIQPSVDETPDVRETVAFARSIGAIAAYAYLGDVGESVTGDKKAECFEDVFLDDLMHFLAQVGFPAVTYMPPRNSLAQMLRLQGLCTKFGLMEISGVDVNSSRQSLRCPELLAPQARHLVDSAWALVAHERLSDHDARWDLFSTDNPLSGLPLRQRIKQYATWAAASDPFEPETIVAIANHG